MKLTLSILILAASTAVHAAPQQWVLSADTWERPRDGLAISRMEPLPAVVSAWSEDTGKQLVIRYPGGERGQLWVHELRSWLVSLGIPLDNLELVAGSERASQIELELSR